MNDTNAATNEKKPSAAVALVLGIFGPLGIGQFYLGQTKRAVLWLIVPGVVFFLSAALLERLGGAVGYGIAFVSVFAIAAIAWIGSLIDAQRIAKHRIRHVGAVGILVYWIIASVITVALRLPVRLFVVEAFRTPSGSMQPTLLLGDHFMVEKFSLRSHPPKRGETIVFKYPENPHQDFVKRVVAVAGDKCQVKYGHLWLNGWEVPHCLVGKASMPTLDDGPSSGEIYVEYLGDQSYLTFFDEKAPDESIQGPYVVAENEVWVLGDNRNNSHDSRFWFQGVGGGVPLGHVKGRPLFRWLSTTKRGVDWSRFGTAISEPLLPQSMKGLEANLAKCLAERPSREKTSPPNARPNAR